MDYNSSMITTKKPDLVFKAITSEVDKWWGKVDQSVSKLGDEFSIFFGETEWRFEITNYDPNKTVIWNCIKANHHHDGLKNIQQEWLHTEIIWEFRSTKEGTSINLTHKGLHEQLNCYDVCKMGWDYYFKSSLKNYLETGNGNPYLD